MTSVEEFDRVIAANVRRFRTAAGMTQAQLADALEPQGFSFQQQTILKIEKGDRPLKFTEALAISHVLGIPPGALLVDPESPPALTKATSRQTELMNELLEINRVYAGKVRDLRDAERRAVEAKAEATRLQSEVSQMDMRRIEIRSELESVYAEAERLG